MPSHIDLFYKKTAQIYSKINKYVTPIKKSGALKMEAYICISNKES